MAIIYITNGTDEDFIAGASIADAAQKAAEERAGRITAATVTPKGGTHYHTISRADAEAFWLAQLAHTIGDNEAFGYGHTSLEAKENAC